MTDTTDIKALREDIAVCKELGRFDVDVPLHIMTRVLDQLEAERQRADANEGYFKEMEKYADKLENAALRLEAELEELKGEQVPVAYLYSASFERGEVEGQLTDAPGCDMPVYGRPQNPFVHPDTKRMDWLCAHCVEVRDPQMYGSHAMFHAQQDSEEWDLPHHTTLREQVDAAIEAAAGGIVKDGD